ncbi:tumor necrosis factor receptor superfamily member 4 [Epinephelus moara]|uniref:tumor necrosis factor receptor superfamily member 4 n=1 Tax=Epinephelus moara TaxID=300413 RepID=UPI00214E61B3|nr:tumor necrosis factor receptor superfamily member 4 [Epinephelus moara]
MVLLKLLIVTLTFYQLVVLDAQKCPKGQRRTRGGAAQPCEDCPTGYYNPEDNDSHICKPCRKCDSNYGSAVKEACTKETNTKCQCRGEFVPAESDSSTCKCEIGFELKSGECSKCEHGYFSTRINSSCRKWKECKSGETNAGSNTADVICNPDVESNPSINTTSTLNKIVTLIKRLTTQRPTPRIITTTTTTPTTTPTSITTAALGYRDPPTSKGQPPHTPDTAAYIGPGMTLLILGIIGLLVLTAVTCKLNITSQPAVPQKDSLCRRPVEESGDGSLSSLKLNPVE